MYSFFFFSAVFNTLISALLGFFVLFKNKKDKVNRSFFYFCISVALWSLFYAGWPQAETAQETLFWFQLLHIGAIFAPITYYHFVLNWLGLFRSKKFSVYLGYFLALVFLSFIFTEYFISDIAPKFSLRYWAEPGIIYHFYLVYFFFYPFYSSVILYVNRKKVQAVKREQINYILIGVILSFLGGSTNYFLWYNINIPPYGNILGSSFVIFTAYVMITKRFLGTTIVVRKSSVYFFSLWTLALFVFFLKMFFNIFSFRNSFFIDIFIVIVSIFCFRLFKKFYYVIANKFFFYSLYDSGASISAISEKLISTLKPISIYNFVFREFNRIFMTKTLAILKHNKTAGTYDLIYSKGVDFHRKSFLKDKVLEKEYFEKNDSVIREEIKACHVGREKGEICKLMIKNADIVIPLTSKKRVVGLMLIGSKASGDFYTLTDIKMLKVVAAQLASAIESRELYTQINKLNRSLRKKVEEQTADIKKKAIELKQKNAKLERLLEMKSDFLRVVNHQLNTPISIIRNSVYMMRKKHFSREKGLSFINEGLKRMEEIIHDFWRAFKLEGESMKIKKEKTNIESLIDEIVEKGGEISPKKKKNIKIKVHKPFKIPEVLCGQKEMIQAFSNLFNNAISYTNKGQIDISYEKENGSLKVLVKDTGCGIDEKDYDRIFDKFTRGQRATSVRPGGSGLGLYISKKIVEASGGYLRLEESHLGKGSTFSFTVPISIKN